MGSFDQNDAPKTCGLLSPWQPPMGQGAGWQLERRTYKNGVHFFPLKLPCSISFPLLPVCLCLGPLWMWVTSHFTASCDWPYGPDSPPTAHPTPPHKKKKRVKENNKSSLYRLLLLSVIREHWSHWQIWGWAIRFHTHCKLDFTAHFKTDEHFLYGHKEA